MIVYFIDLFWIPLAWIAAGKDQRLTAVGTIGAGLVLMRLQAELMEVIGFSHGLFDYMNSGVFLRLLVFYSACYAAYICTLLMQPKQKGVFLLSASIGGFFIVLVLSTVLMVL